MTISQLEEAGIRKVATKVTTTLNCLEGAVQFLPLYHFPPQTFSYCTTCCTWIALAGGTAVNATPLCGAAATWSR